MELSVSWNQMQPKWCQELLLRISLSWAPEAQWHTLVGQSPRSDSLLSQISWSKSNNVLPHLSCNHPHQFSTMVPPCCPLSPPLSLSQSCFLHTFKPGLVLAPLPGWPQSPRPLGTFTPPHLPPKSLWIPGTGAPSLIQNNAVATLPARTQNLPSLSHLASQLWHWVCLWWPRLQQNCRGRAWSDLPVPLWVRASLPSKSKIGLQPRPLCLLLPHPSDHPQNFLKLLSPRPLTVSYLTNSMNTFQSVSHSRAFLLLFNVFLEILCTK